MSCSILDHPQSLALGEEGVKINCPHGRKAWFAALARRGQVLVLSDNPEDGPNVGTREDDITF